MGNTPKNQDHLPKDRIKPGGWCLDKPGASTMGVGVIVHLLVSQRQASKKFSPAPVACGGGQTWLTNMFLNNVHHICNLLEGSRAEIHEFW